MKPILVSILAFLSLTIGPGIAHAADTFVSPSGSGNACTQAAPCSILTAGGEAEANSAIILAPGIYGSAADPIDDRIYTFAPNANWVGRADVTLHIDASASDGSVSVYSGQKFLGYGTKIISSDLAGISIYGSGEAHRVHVRTSLDSSVACRLGNEGMLTGGRIVNSLCVADGFGSVGIKLAATRNDEAGSVLASTAVSLGTGGSGIQAENTGVSGGGSGYSQMEVYLSVASAPAGYDLDAGYDSDGNNACIATVNTAAITIRPNGCGVTEDNPIRETPGFVEASSDFHLAPESALIDSVQNLSSPVPALDLDGNSRDPANPDPGAYEFQNPAPPARCVVPRLRGLKLPQVRNRLRGANCRLGRVARTKVSKKRKVGRVLRQSPAAGRNLTEGSRVRVTIGKMARTRR